MSDQQIIELIRSKKQQKAFVKLYKHFKMIRNMIREKGGNKEDAEDIFQEALIVLYRKCEDSTFQLTSTLSTYLYSVSKYLWNDELKRRKRENQPLNGVEVSQSENILSADIERSRNDRFENESNDYEEIIFEEEKYKKAENVLAKIGTKCLKLLKLFYVENKSMKEIAKKMELSSEKIAKNQKYKCLERAKLNYRKSF